MDEIITIDLFGEEFKFKPDNQVDNPEQVAQHLKKYLKEAESLFPKKSTGKNKLAILLLAAMNLSKDFHELKMQKTKLESQVNSRISSIEKKLSKDWDKN